MTPRTSQIGGGPGAYLPHHRDPFRLADMSARGLEVTGARGGGRRAQMETHRAGLAGAHLRQFALNIT